MIDLPKEDSVTINCLTMQITCVRREVIDYVYFSSILFRWLISVLIIVLKFFKYIKIHLLISDGFFVFRWNEKYYIKYFFGDL